MALSNETSKAIYIQELISEYGSGNIDMATAEKAARVITKTINRILLEKVEINAGSFTSPTGPVSGQGVVN